jgi:outer membrane protein assembly factor BamD
MPLLRRRLAAGIALLLLLCACSEKLSKQTGLTDANLLARGERNFALKKYGPAIEAFQLLLERFPTSPLAARAQLRLAEARMENKDDVEAEVAFDDFLRLYPASDNVPYALFRKGELLARQVGDPARDQTKTQDAVKAFTLLLENDPKGPYAARAAERIRELRARLAAHEERVVSYYLRRKQFESAESRARRAVAEYPDTKETPRLMALLADALDRAGKKAEAIEVRKSLSEKFPPGGAKTR